MRTDNVAIGELTALVEVKRLGYSEVSIRRPSSPAGVTCRSLRVPQERREMLV